MKKKVVTVTAVVSTALIGVGAVPVVLPETAIQAEAVELGDWRYEIDGNEVTLLGLSRAGVQTTANNGGKLPDFPIELEGHPVTEIGDGAFKGMSITELPMSWGTIRYVGSGAFFDNPITKFPVDGKVDSEGNIFNNGHWPDTVTTDGKGFALSHGNP